jgi:transcriptional regulator with XRE-family HTH domain
MLNLKNIRVNQNVTAAELAALLEVSLRTYWRIERGKRYLRECEQEKILKYVDELMEIRRQLVKSYRPPGKGGKEACAK